MSEYDFVLACTHRRRGHCVGPLVPLTLDADQLDLFDSACREVPQARTLMWDGFEASGDTFWLFCHCAAHWMDLLAVVSRVRQPRTNPGQLSDLAKMLRRVFAGAGLDRKEMSNRLRPPPR